MTNDEFRRRLDDLMTPDEARRAFRIGSKPISLQTLYTWRSDRGLPHVLIRSESKHALRFLPDELDTWARRERIEFHPPRINRRRAA